MKNVFSCSDFLSDLWQGGPDGTETLGGLPCPASEGGSTQLGREGSTDLLNLLNQAEEADSTSRTLANLAASSSNKQDSSGTGVFAKDRTVKDHRNPECQLLHCNLHSKVERCEVSWAEGRDGLPLHCKSRLQVR